jgi:thiol-disulfide isomerase/thioredoxin
VAARRSWLCGIASAFFASYGLLPIASAATGEPAAGLPEGWKRRIELRPADGGGRDQAAKPPLLFLRVEMGWLVIDRVTPATGTDWHVVLARAVRPNPPEVRVEKGEFELEYGPYFIREARGQLRILRERKLEGVPLWPLESPPGNTTKALGQAGNSPKLVAWDGGDWCWVTSGLYKQRADLWIRMQHMQLVGTDFRFGTHGSRLAKALLGGTSVQDEGDLLVADRALPEDVERLLDARKLREKLGNAPAPELQVRQWLNDPAPRTLESLRGRVVLLDFWGKWCGPCVKGLPRAEELYAKYKPRGLVVIGIHSENDSQGVEEFIREKKLTFPVTVDNGQTAKRYFVTEWPTYFLINKTGRVSWGFSPDLPTERQIEEELSK